MAQVSYEFLVRWNPDTGALKGASIKLFDTVMQREGDAQPVAVAGAAGFPLTDIMTALQSGAVISMDAANASLVTVQAALDAANVTLAANQSVVDGLNAKIQALTPPPAPAIPVQVTMRQARIALLRAGYLTQIDAAIAALTGAAGQEAQITWNSSSTVRRDNPLLAQIASTFGLTSAQLDGLFTLAATL